MSDAFSDYVALLDDVEHIPETARKLPTLSTEQRAAAMRRVVDLVRDRVLPQSDREEEGLSALFFSTAGSAGDESASSRARDHGAIAARVDELARVDPDDGVRMQKLLYRLHAAIAEHFGDAELMLASASDLGSPPAQGRRVASGVRFTTDARRREYVTPSPWFG